MVNRAQAAVWVRAGLAALVIAASSAACHKAEKPAPDPKAERANLDFTVKDMNGKDVRLADYKGRPLLLNFWATWCGPCKIEIPALVELSEKYKGRNLTVLGISVDDTAEDLRKFTADHRMPYPILMALGHDDLLEAYDAQMGVPVSVFIRPDGTVAMKQSGGQTKAWFETQVKALF
jgi:cytochrome c biogenesis protein CcmG/thiol:disulfide interchange protein DsbE